MRDIREEDGRNYSTVIGKSLYSLCHHMDHITDIIYNETLSLGLRAVLIGLQVIVVKRKDVIHSSSCYYRIIRLLGVVEIEYIVISLDRIDGLLDTCRETLSILGITRVI